MTNGKQIFCILQLPKLSDFILYVTVVTVAEGFSLRFLSSDRLMRFSRKLRNPSIRSGQALKVAATIIAQFRNYILKYQAKHILHFKEV
jgi:hypothetical protein